MTTLDARSREVEARLREALKPFADCCEEINDSESDEEWAKFRLLIKDYRRAQDAVKDIDLIAEQRAEIERLNAAMVLVPRMEMGPQSD